MKVGPCWSTIVEGSNADWSALSRSASEACGGVAELTNLSFAIGFVGVIAILIAPPALASAAARRREEANRPADSGQRHDHAQTRPRTPRPHR